ncbi:MAG: hypothetical protein JW904_00760 [Spirochaetales bacterium]|nr:hypothetical protein [Spirochaetales bacterium]
MLDEIKGFLALHPDVTIELHGYTNASGTPDQEQALSRARVEALSGS